MKSEIYKVIELFGSQETYAQAVGVAPRTVTKWVKSGFIPARKVWETTLLTDGRKTHLGEVISIESLLSEAYEKTKTDGIEWRINNKEKYFLKVDDLKTKLSHVLPVYKGNSD